MSDSSRGVVLDSSAVLAFLLGESGGDYVKPLLPSGKLGIVNCAEVLARLTGKGVPIAEAESLINELDVEIVPFTLRQAIRSAELRPITRSAGLSLGDRACLALAYDLGIPAITADRAWQAFAGLAGVEINLIR